jgi:hypothetical protein
VSVSVREEKCGRAGAVVPVVFVRVCEHVYAWGCLGRLRLAPTVGRVHLPSYLTHVFRSLSLCARAFLSVSVHACFSLSLCVCRAGSSIAMVMFSKAPLLTT